MVESVRTVCGSVRVEGKNPKTVWWNDEIKAAVMRKEAAWKEVLVVSDKIVLEGGVMRKEERGRVAA